MKLRNLFILPCILALFLLGCAIAAQHISDIKSDENIGKTVTVSGTVTDVVSFGNLSYYIIDDGTGTIPVSVKNLPAKGEKVAVQGTLLKEILVGYYLKVIES